MDFLQYILFPTWFSGSSNGTPIGTTTEFIHLCYHLLLFQEVGLHIFFLSMMIWAWSFVHQEKTLGWFDCWFIYLSIYLSCFFKVEWVHITQIFSRGSPFCSIHKGSCSKLSKPTKLFYPYLVFHYGHNIRQTTNHFTTICKYTNIKLLCSVQVLWLLQRKYSTASSNSTQSFLCRSLDALTPCFMGSMAATPKESPMTLRDMGN